MRRELKDETDEVAVYDIVDDKDRIVGTDVVDKQAVATADRRAAVRKKVDEAKSVAELRAAVLALLDETD